MRLVRANAGRRRRAAVQVKGRTTIKSLAEQAGRCPLVMRCRKVAMMRCRKVAMASAGVARGQGCAWRAPAPAPGNARAWLDLQRSVRMLQAAAENPEGLQAAFGGGR